MKNTTGLRPEIQIVVEIGCTFFLDATEVNYVMLSRASRSNHARKSSQPCISHLVAVALCTEIS